MTIAEYIKGKHPRYREKLWAAFLWRERWKAEGYRLLWGR